MKFTTLHLLHNERSLTNSIAKALAISFLLPIVLAFAYVSANAQKLDYGIVKIGGTKTLEAVTLCTAAIGQSCITFGKVSLAGPNANEFKITVDGCSGVTLPGRGICGVAVAFTPQSSGPKQATLLLISAASQVLFTYSLVGVGGDGGSIRITQPTSNQIFRLAPPDFTAAVRISFQTEIASPDQNNLADWNVKLEYATSGGLGGSEDPRTFQTQAPISPAHEEQYKSMGGKLTINATATVNGQRENAPPVNAFIVGIAIPDQQITDRLLKLYHGATPNLMTGIAQQESSYRQFRVLTLYGINERWPNESFDGGSHVGLMQVETNMRDAWDWEANTQEGVKVFGDKLASARRIMQKIIKDHKGLRKLTDVELENMALVLYGPHANGDRGKQYYAPKDIGNGKWDWIVNTAGNPAGVNYADSVRNSMR